MGRVRQGPSPRCDSSLVSSCTVHTVIADPAFLEGAQGPAGAFSGAEYLCACTTFRCVSRESWLSLMSRSKGRRTTFSVKASCCETARMAVLSWEAASCLSQWILRSTAVPRSDGEKRRYPRPSGADSAP